MGPAPLALWLYLPLAALALCGLIGILFALFFDTSRGRRRCPRCWYDMRGTTGLRCPECGHEARTEQDLLRTRRRLGLAAFSLALVLPLLAFFVIRDGRRVWYALPPKWTTTQSVEANGVVAKAMKRRNPDELEGRATLTGGDQLIAVTDHHVELGLPRWDPSTGTQLPTIGAGDDFNSDGILEVLLTQYSGGAHCCYTVTVVEMSQPARIVAVIDAGNGMTAEKLPSGEILLNIPDQSFDYWRAPHAGSPFPDVWYRLKNHRLEVAIDKMLAAEPPLDDVSFGPRAAFIRTITTTDPRALNADLWSPMLDYLYSGREAECWRFFDACWPDDAPGKEEFKADFLGVLQGSPRWRDFAAAREAHRNGALPPAAGFPSSLP